jgi:hypothetical protein
MNEDIKEIIKASINAPSGSNSQPWKFEVKGNKITIIALPERDHPVLNFHNRGTWIAHGALIENIVIAAAQIGYSSSIVQFPDRQRQNITAHIILSKIEKQEQPLFDAIKKRATNRKKYNAREFTAEERNAIIASTQGIQNCELRLIEDKKAMKKVGIAVSKNEVVMLENKELHNLFFDEVVWTEQEEKKKGKGLYVKTMELKPPQKAAFKLFRYWLIMNFVNKLGVAKGIAKGNAKIYASGSAIGVIIAPNRDEVFINVGRMMERIWLQATALNLSFHLVTGVLFLHQGIQGNVSNLSEKHKEIIKSAYKEVADSFKVNDQTIAILFRIGDGGNPSGTSLKTSPQIAYT